MKYQKVSNFHNKLIFLFPLSIFIMMFDLLPVYPNISISIYAIIQTILILLMVIYLLIRGNIKLKLYTTTLLLLLGFLFIVILFIPFSFNVNESIFEVFRLFKFIVLAFIINLFLKNIWREDYFIYFAIIMLICGYLAGLSIITDYLEITNFSLLYLRNTNIREFGLLGESNFAAGKLTIFLPFTFFLLQFYASKKKFRKSLLIFLGICIILLAILLTGSRMGGGAAIFSLILFFVKEKRKIFKFRTFFNVITIGIIIFLFISVFGDHKIINLNKIDFIINRYKDLNIFIKTKGNLINDLSISQRIECLNAGFKMFKDFPLTGVGLGNYVYKVKDYSSFIFKYSHNTFISVLAETGFIGFVLFIGLFIQIGKQIYQRYRRSVNSDFYFYLGISFMNLIIMLFFLHDFGNKYFWGIFIPLSMYFEFNKLYIKQEKNKFV